jgi:hypothetical protein
MDAFDAGRGMSRIFTSPLNSTDFIIQAAVKTDIAEPSYKTTVGPDQFRELVLNRVLQRTVNPNGGRPAKVC